MKDILKIVAAMALFSFIVAPFLNIAVYVFFSMLQQRQPSADYHAMQPAPQCYGLIHGK